MRLHRAGRDLPGATFLLSVLDRFPQVIRLDWDAPSRELLATLVLRGALAKAEEEEAQTLLRALVHAYTALTGETAGSVFLTGTDRTGFRVLTIRWEDALPDAETIGLLIAGLVERFGERLLWDERTDTSRPALREEEGLPEPVPESRLVAYREDGRAMIRVG